LLSEIRRKEEGTIDAIPFANEEDDETTIQQTESEGLIPNAVNWTAPVGLPPPHKLGDLRPPTQLDAESKGRQQAEEILGKSKFDPTRLFHLSRSIEGISTGTTSTCDDDSMEDMCTNESSTTSDGDATKCAIRTPTTCFVGMKNGGKRSPSNFSDSLSIIHHADTHNPTTSNDDRTCLVQIPSAHEGESPSAMDGDGTCLVQIPTCFEGERPSAGDGDGTCVVRIPSSYEGERPSAMDGDGTCFVQVPSSYEGVRPSILDGDGTRFVQIPSSYESERPSAMDGDGTRFVRIPSSYEGEKPSILDGDGTCFVQIPSTYEGERPSAVDSRGVWPIDLVDRVRSILQLPIRQPTKPEFSFELSMESAEKNFLILTKKYSGSLKAALEGQHESPLGMGSEFRPIDILETIYGNHPIWSRMKPILQQGSTWPLEDLSEEQRLSDVLEAIKFGNHKGAQANPNAILKLVSKDVKHGYAVAFPLSKAHLIPGVLIAPMNIMHQNTIDETGRIVEKERLTHDQSYIFGSGTSVNSRVRADELMPCMYGACLRRLINWVCTARAEYPGIGIFATKVDFKSAYRRCHANAATALQSCTQLLVNDEDELLLMFLRLTFGGKACPSEWSALAEPQCDLSNALLHDDEWDPASLTSPSQHRVSAPDRNAERNRPFGVGRELVVDIPINPRGIYDLYLDDIIGLSLDMPETNNLERSAAAHLLAIATTARPSHENEPIPREAMEAEAKLAAEASPEEIKLILGWLMDFRELLVSLPDNKYIAWSADIKSMLTNGSAKAKQLETLIGRLGHLGMVIPFVYHFLSRLREWHHKTRNKRYPSQMTKECRNDLLLMLKFLDKAHVGIDMNLISYRRPTHIYRSDSCPFGLGGYSDEGFAWRFELPPNLRFRASNNLLEFMASIISPWIDIIAKRLSKSDCALSMTDSTTSAGWIRKTNFKEDGLDPIEATTRIEIARHHALLFIDNDIKEYSQWFEGKKNQVADALSREFERTDTELTDILRSLFPSQLPQHFEIVPLPNEISSWLTSSLQKLPVKEQLREVHTRAKLDPGVVTNCISNRSDLDMMSSSTHLQDPKETGSCARLPWLCGKQDFQDRLMTDWLKEQSEIPSRMFARPSGRTEDLTQPKTTIGNLASFYNDYFEHSETKTQTRDSRKRSLPTSSSQ